MEQTKADQLIALYNDKISTNYVEDIRQSLLNVDSAKASMIFGDLRNPTNVLIVSLIGGAYGIDRFLIGDVLLGILKLIYGILTTIFTCGLLTWVWWLIDLFLIKGATRKYNSRKLLKVLANYQQVMR